MSYSMARVLDVVPPDPPGLTVASISDAVGISAGLTHKHLMTLIKDGVVQRKTIRSEHTGLPAYGYFLAASIRGSKE
jgi:predicted ArsR family transcriptional regulator